MSTGTGDVTIVAPPDPLEPLRTTDRRARTVAGATIGGTLAGMAAAATIPLWSDEERLRPILAASDVRDSFAWAWDLSPSDGWWAFGLMLLVPCLAATAGAVVSWRRLLRAAAAPPFQVCAAESRPVPASATSGAGRLTDAQRRARERGRREEISTQQRYAVIRAGRGLSVWTHLGGGFAVVVGVWFGTALVLAALGMQATPLGIGIATASWWIALVPVLAWEGFAAARRALVRRRPEPSNLQ